MILKGGYREAGGEKIFSSCLLLTLDNLFSGSSQKKG
jgi:hypothetical protein